MTAGNFLAYAAQVAVIVLACAGLPRLLRLRAPEVHYAYWRVVLLLCVTLPLLQPWRELERRAGSDAIAQAQAQPAPAPLVPSPADAPPAPPPAFNWVTVLPIVLIAGAGARLAWMMVGINRLIVLRRRSAASPALGFDDLRETIGTTAPILWSADVRHPVTFGLLHPVVLLPSALKSVDHGAQRAVVAHELHHVKRRDWGWVIGEEIVRSIFWFHPAMWWLISRVQLARETVVDELSILVTNARRTYLDTLLAFADDTGLRSSPAFSARRHLFHRVMLLSKEGGMSSSRIAVVTGALIVALAAGTWTAVNAFPLYGTVAPAAGARITEGRAAETPPAQAERPPRDPRPQERPRPANLVSFAFDRAQLADVLRMFGQMANVDMQFDASMTARVTAQATNVPWDQGLRQILEPLGLSFDVKGNTVHVLGTVRQMSPPPPPPPPPHPSAMSADYQRAVEAYKPLRIGGGFTAPTKVKDVKPVYPPIAQSAKIQGVVIVEAIIDETGRVAATRVLRSIPLLDAAALSAVEQWEFTPTLLNGRPTPVLMTLTVNFRIE